MKKYYLLIFSLLSFEFVSAQAAVINQSHLSANLQQYLLDPNNYSKKSLITMEIGGIVYLNALIKVNSKIDESQLTQLGIFINTKAGNIWTVLIPRQNLVSFTTLRNIDYIQLDEPIVSNLDIARKTTRVDSVQNGINLPIRYSGKGVVVGIIDAGFDYSHPTFYDTTGNKLRIKRVWEQRQTGTPPNGFVYGNEISDTSAMLTKGTELPTFTHGTHVAGIAAGSGVGSTKFRGMAYESDLVFVRWGARY